jgi:pimeloyl-ACP methyl ester carboxylesterase
VRRPGAGALHPLTFTTSDGVELGLVRTGPAELPPLVLVHGTATAYQCFDPIVPALAEAKHVVALDRRGRGLSGDGTASYDVAREVQDVIEVARFVGGDAPVDVFGYSYGGMLTLLAIGVDAAAFRRVVVYEPPFAVADLTLDGMAADVEALLDKGDVNEALRQFVCRTFHLPMAVVDVMADHPMWQVSLATEPTLMREFAAVASTPVPNSLPSSVPVRVLVAAEGGNPAFQDIASSLPGADIVPVGGIPHFAIPTDTATVASAVVSFLA